MPICPNKNTEQWKSLIAKLKERNPKDTDQRIEDYAYFAFFSKGDGSIPTIEEAAGILFKGKTKQIRQDAKDAFSDFRKTKRIGEKTVKDSQKEFAQRVSDYLDGLSKRGVISVSQAKTIARRASKIGSSEAAFNRFTKYAESVIENANYEAEMSDVRKMQSAASKPKGPLTPQIKDFTKINPEDIPAEMLTRYKQALDLLTGKVPNPKMMIEMFPEIQELKNSLAKEGEVEADNSAQMEKLVQDISSREMETVEDYRKQISDINKLKRKLTKMLENEEITEEQFDKLSEDIGFTQREFEEKNKAEIDALKSEYVDEISGKKITVDVELTPEQKKLVDGINAITEAELMEMSPEELYVLNEAIDVANDGYIDVAKLNDALNAAESVGAKDVATQLNRMKDNDKNTATLLRRLMAKDDTFWETALGLPVNKIGKMYLELIAPFRRGMANYVQSVNTIRKKKYEIEKKYKLKKEQKHKIGMVVHYLQEYMRQFDPKQKNIPDVGNRDEFSYKLFSKDFTDKVDDKSTLETVRGVYDSLPKAEDGKVSPKEVYDDYINNGGRYLTESERAYLDDVWNTWSSDVTPKLEYATELRGNPLKKIAFYMPRETYSIGGMERAESPVTVATNKNMRIESPFAKERTMMDVVNSDIPKTDFSYLMDRSLEATMRDYEVTRMLHTVNRRLNKSYEFTDGNKKKYLDALVQRMQSGINEQIGIKTRDGSADMIDKIQGATAVRALFDITRTFLGELPSGFLSYPIRSGTLGKGWTQAFKSTKLANELKAYTESPLRIKENINAKYDVDAQRVVLPPLLNRVSSWMTGFTEAHLNNMIWVPTFEQSFRELSGQKFDAKKFRESEAYRNEFKKEIKDAGATADQETQEIVGPTTTASARATIDNIFTNMFSEKKQLNARSNMGRIISFMGGYAYRDYSSTIKGLIDASNGYGESGSKSLLSLYKPLGVLVGVASYGYLIPIKQLIDKYLISLFTDNEEELNYAKEQLAQKFDYEGVKKEMISNGLQVMSGKFGADGKMAITALGTAAYYAAKDEETRKWISDIVRGTTYTKIPDLSKVGDGAYGKMKSKEAIQDVFVKNISVLGTVTERLVDLAGGTESAWQVIQKVNEGEDLGDKKDLANALNFIYGSTQAILLTIGTSIPESKKIKSLIDGLKGEEANYKRKRRKLTIQ